MKNAATQGFQLEFYVRKSRFELIVTSKSRKDIDKKQNWKNSGGDSKRQNFTGETVITAGTTTVCLKTIILHHRI